MACAGLGFFIGPLQGTGAVLPYVIGCVVAFGAVMATLYIALAALIDHQRTR